MQEGSGTHLRLAQTGLWAQLTMLGAGTPSPYAWQQVQPAGDGTWELLSSGLTGTSASNQAYAVPDSNSLAVGSSSGAVVWLTPGKGAENLFAAVGGTSATSACPITWPYTTLAVADPLDLTSGACAGVYRLTGSGTITRIIPLADEQVAAFLNIGCGNITLTSGASMTSGGILTPGGFPISLQCDGGIILYYDPASLAWEALSMESGGQTGNATRLTGVSFDADSCGFSCSSTAETYVNGRLQQGSNTSTC